MKLSYTTFEETVRTSIVEDYFVRGLDTKLQIALKTGKDFSTSDIKSLASEAVRLEIAGVSNKQIKVDTVNEIGIGKEEWVNVVAEKVFEKVKGLNIASNSYTEHSDNEVNASYVNNKFPSDYQVNTNRYRNSNSRYQAGKWNNRVPKGDSLRRCRSCNRTEHFVRSCPKRYCQACGEQGHDQSDRNCKKFQP